MRILEKKMHLNNMFIHPSVMMRSDSLIKVGGYQGIYKSCEDYDLFFRLMSIGKVHNLPEVLINYEVNFLSISSLKRKTQIKNRLKLQLKYFKIIKFGFFPIYGIFRTLAILFCKQREYESYSDIIKKIIFTSDIFTFGLKFQLDMMSLLRREFYTLRNYFE